MKSTIVFRQPTPFRNGPDDDGIYAEFFSDNEADEFKQWVRFFKPQLQLVQTLEPRQDNYELQEAPDFVEFKTRMSMKLTPASKLAQDINKVAELGMAGDAEALAFKEATAKQNEADRADRMLQAKASIVGSIAPPLPDLAINTKPEQILVSALAAVRGEGYTKAVIVLAKEDEAGTVLLTRLFMAGCNSTYAKGLLMEGITSVDAND